MTSRPPDRPRYAPGAWSPIAAAQNRGCDQIILPGMEAGRNLPRGVTWGDRRVMSSVVWWHLASRHWTATSGCLDRRTPPSHVPSPRPLSRLQPPPRHDSLRYHVPASGSERTAVLRNSRRVVRGLQPAVHRSRADRVAGPRRGTLRVRDRERSRGAGAGLVSGPPALSAMRRRCCRSLRQRGARCRLKPGSVAAPLVPGQPDGFSDTAGPGLAVPGQHPASFEPLDPRQ